MSEQARVRTPIAMPTAGRLLLAAFGGGLSQHQAALLLAQVALETAQGAACDNNNLGNLTGTFNGFFFRPAWFELAPDASPKLQALHAAMLKGQAPSQFRAYPEPLLGAIDYAKLIKARFPSILAAAAANDPDGMASAIKSSGYTPDLPAGVGASLRSLRDKFLPLFADLPPGPPEPSGGIGMLVLFAAIAWGLSNA